MTTDHEARSPLWVADSPPPADPSGVTQRMAELIRRWEAAGDPRAIFLSCYTMMTHNMLAAIEHGEFHDPAWVLDLLERFAGYYFTALDEYDAGTAATPAAWRLAFQFAQGRGVHVMQHLLLGINAHINYDLVLCLGDVLQGEWAGLSAEARSARYRDHCHVNAVIAGTVDAVQDQVVDRYSSLMAAVDTAFGGLDEWLMGRLIAHWREQVWERALLRVEMPDDALREAQRRRLEDEVTAFGHLIRMDDFHAALRALL
jgi:hypothetical protein